MDIFLITPPEGIDPYQIFNDLSIDAKSDISCVNCYVAELNLWQITELRNLEFTVFKNTTCSI